MPAPMEQSRTPLSPADELTAREFVTGHASSLCLSTAHQYLAQALATIDALRDDLEKSVAHGLRVIKEARDVDGGWYWPDVLLTPPRDRVPLNRGPFDGKTCEVPLLPTKIFVVRRTTSAEPEPGYLVHLALDHPGVQPPVAIGAAIIGVYRWRADSGAFEWTGTLEGE